MNSASIEEMIVADSGVRTPISGLPQLLATLSDENVNMQDVVGALERFPSISGRLLAVANSAWSAPPEPITSFHSACMHLGLRLVRSISISLAVCAPFNGMRCPAFDATRFWHSGLLVSDAASRLSVQRGDLICAEPGTMATAGLLHHLGLLWLADRLADDVNRACIMAAQGENGSVNDALVQIIGTDIGTVTGILLRSWGLPEMLATTITHHRHPEYVEAGWRSAAILGAAVELESIVRHAPDSDVPTPNLDRLDIRPESRGGLLDEIRATSEKVHGIAAAVGHA